MISAMTFKMELPEGHATLRHGASVTSDGINTHTNAYISKRAKRDDGTGVGRYFLTSLVIDVNRLIRTANAALPRCLAEVSWNVALSLPFNRSPRDFLFSRFPALVKWRKQGIRLQPFLYEARAIVEDKRAKRIGAFASRGE
jgi:hypothetical protein